MDRESRHPHLLDNRLSSLNSRAQTDVTLHRLPSISDQRTFKRAPMMVAGCQATVEHHQFQLRDNQENPRTPPSFE